VSSTHLGTKTRILLLSDTSGFVHVARPLWREDGSVLYNYYWYSPAHSRVRVPRDTWLYFTVSDSSLPQPGGPGPCIYVHQEHGGPVIPPGTGVPFLRLLRLAGLRWKYSLPPSRGIKILISTKQYIKILSVPHRKHIMSPLQRPTC
jgi:hypothetical protein